MVAEMKIEEGYEFKFDLEQIWYIAQACTQGKATEETNIRIARYGFAEEEFINRCEYNIEQYNKILQQLTEVVKREWEQRMQKHD